MKTVAVAEDEPITRMDICAMLEDLGFSIAGEASDGFDAIELCRRTRPDVILMDVKMPIFDGLAAAETITYKAFSMDYWETKDKIFSYLIELTKQIETKIFSTAIPTPETKRSV